MHSRAAGYRSDCEGVPAGIPIDITHCHYEGPIEDREWVPLSVTFTRRTVLCSFG